MGYIPNKPTQICGSIKNPAQWADVISGLNSCIFYAYIYHDSDSHADGTQIEKHLHFVAIDTPRKLSTWGNMLNLPENMIQYCRSPRASVRYLTHYDDPSKHQYELSQVITNKPARVKGYYENRDKDINSEYLDYMAVRQGKMPVCDFLEKYNLDIQKMNIYNRIKMFKELQIGMF